VWRFPGKFAPEVSVLSDRFNNSYKSGFKLLDLHVKELGGKWSLYAGKNLLLEANAEHAAGRKQSAQMIALQWLSRLYEALGALDAASLTPKYQLRGKYELSGAVSWYGGKFLGRKFANGERFTENHLTAAAKSLPFGTLVKVTSPSTGKSVVVRVTDRFKEHKNRVLDISEAAAEILDITSDGAAPVTVKVIGKVDDVGGK
jgi:rare lipoprotein A